MSAPCLTIHDLISFGDNGLIPACSHCSFQADSVSPSRSFSFFLFSSMSARASRIALCWAIKFAFWATRSASLRSLSATSSACTTLFSYAFGRSSFGSKAVASSTMVSLSIQERSTRLQPRSLLPLTFKSSSSVGTAPDIRRVSIFSPTAASSASTSFSFSSRLVSFVVIS